MTTTSIYCLSDPDTHQVRYVGKSSRPAKRFREHVASAGDKKTHRDCWVLSLISSGRNPVFEILAEVPVLEWEFWERAYIKFFKELGCDLTNATEGGEGAALGVPLSPEHRQKISKSSRGRPHSPEHCKKISEALTGRTMSPEHRRKLSVYRTGKKASDELKEKYSEMRSGSGNPMFGKHHSEETKAKIRATKLAAANNLK